MAVFQIALANFAFPADLPDDKANFRFVFDVRYVDTKGAFATEHAILPSFDTYWECDKRKSTNPNYVRGANASFGFPGGQVILATFDISKIDAWDRLILCINAQSIHSLQFKAFDVNRDDVWNRLKEALGQIVQALLGKAKGLLTGLPGPVQAASDALGTAASDLESHLLKRLSNGDELLTRGSIQLSGAGSGVHAVVTPGTGGLYRLEVQLR